MPSPRAQRSALRRRPNTPSEASRSLPGGERARGRGRQGLKALAGIAALNALNALAALNALVALNALAGCGGQPAPKARSHDPQVSIPEPSAAAFASPARWHYHPSAPEQALAHVRLEGGGCVITAEGGQRWTITPARGSASTPPGTRGGRTQPPGGQGEPAAPGCAGQAQAASVLAVEDLVGIVRRGPSAWVFVGETGALYETGSPLAPFTRSVPAPEPLSKVAGSGSSMLAATLDGKLLRWSDAGGWQRSTSIPARVFDLAVVDGGRALALGIPEALFASDDGGATWTPATRKTIGAHRVGVTAAGELGAEGILESTTWDPRRTPAFSASSEPLADRAVDIDAAVSASPSAAAVMYRRAVIDGERYYEIDHRDDSEEGFSLARGRIGAPLEVVPVPDTADCGSMKLGASGRQVVLACVRAAGDSIVARVRRSEDAGSTWSDPLLLETPDTDGISIAVAPGGAILMTGVCRQAEASSACKPAGPLLLRPEGRRLSVATVEVSGLGGPALLPAFSVDGRSAYLLGLREKDERLALFVSHDGGETFAQRPLEREATRGDPETAARPDPDSDADAEGSGGKAGRESYDVNEEASLFPGEDGTVGMVLVGDGGITYVTTDEDGRVLRASRPPADEVLMAGFGQRLIALKPEGDGAPDGIRIWESLDGGGTWTDIPGTRALDRDFFRSSPAIACGGGGCLLGDTVARIGWGGQAEPRADDAPEIEPSRVPSLRTPIVCELAPTSRFTRVENVYGAGEPDLDEVMRGRSAWSLLTWDKKTGAVSVVSAMLPESGDGPATVVSRPLFARAQNPAQIALDLSHQMEGYAGARVRFATDAKGEVKLGAPMRGVEIAWENFIDGTSGRATIPDAGPFELGDIKSNRALAYDPALLSVSLQGIFVRPHSPSARSGITYFLEPGGKTSRFDYPGWPNRGLKNRNLTFRDDAVIAGGSMLAIGMERLDGPFTSLLLASRSDAGWTTTAASVAPKPADHPDLLTLTDWAYSGKSIGVTALVTDPRNGRAWATFQPFQSDGSLGPAAELGTPFDVGASPRPCKPSDRASTTRFEAPLTVRGEIAFAGTRHPVLVTDLAAAGPARATSSSARPSPSMSLLTWGAVLHGPPSAPCVAAWDAIAWGAPGSPPVTAVVSGDLEHAWLFRTVTPDAAAPRPGSPRAPSGAGQPTNDLKTIEYRPMTCRFDPTAKVPESVWNVPGTSRIER